MSFQKRINLQTEHYQQYINITNVIKDTVLESGIVNGQITVITNHTTTGIMVNEDLECLLRDIENFLGKNVSEKGDYYHARMLREYGSTAGNVVGHLKSLIVGNHAHGLVIDCNLSLGSAQQIFFCEFDGPAQRTFHIYIHGE